MPVRNIKASTLWPRLITVTQAAAYVGFNTDRFKAVPKLAALIKTYFGQTRVDRFELDQVIEEENISQQKNLMAMAKGQI